MGLVCIFPVGSEAQAQTYLDFCNEHNPDPTPGAIWYMPQRLDKYNQTIVPYLGPGGGWNGGDFDEPEGGEAARAGSVFASMVEWPDPEE